MKQKRVPLPRLRLSLLLVLITIVGTLIGRYLWWQYLVDLRGPLGFMGIFCILMPAVLLIGLLISICCGLVVWFLYRYRAQGLFPIAILIIGVGVVFRLPMPPDPPTREMKHFLEHRADYEAVVELARQDDLKEHCAYGGPLWYRPPSHLAHVSTSDCLEVDYDGNFGQKTNLRVGFFPFEQYYHSLVYSENDTHPHPCFLDATVEQKIEPHWYVCEGEWN